jgi:dipeptidyl aminopeptidase/acylaminoacyl peptidase
VYNSSRGGRKFVTLDWRAADGSGTPDSLAGNSDATAGLYAMASDGMLAYVPLRRFLDPSRWQPMEFVGRDGKVEPTRLPDGIMARFSPDGRRLVYMRGGAKTTDIFTYDLDRQTEQRLTGDEGEEYWPIFSPDGRRVAYNSSRGGRKFVTLDWRAADGSGGPDSLAWGLQHQQPQSWTAGGAELVYTAGPSDSTLMDTWILPMTGARTPRPLMRSRRLETHPAVSPDGKWLAWAGDATGLPQVLVRRFPDGVDVQVSHDGAWEPVWGPGSRELFFRDLSGRRMFVADFVAGDPPRVGAPRLLFSGSFVNAMPWGRTYDLSPDGRRFLMTKPPADVFGPGYIAFGSEIRIIPHFDSEVRRRLKGATR